MKPVTIPFGVKPYETTIELHKGAFFTAKVEHYDSTQSAEGLMAIVDCPSELSGSTGARKAALRLLPDFRYPASFA